MTRKKIEVYFDEIYNIATLEVEYSIENTGLGRYEFWGIDCYDLGVDEIFLGYTELLKDGLTSGEYDLVLDIIENLDSDKELHFEIVKNISENID